MKRRRPRPTTSASRTFLLSRKVTGHNFFPSFFALKKQLRGAPRTTSSTSLSLCMFALCVHSLTTPGKDVPLCHRVVPRGRRECKGFWRSRKETVWSANRELVNILLISPPFDVRSAVCAVWLLQIVASCASSATSSLAFPCESSFVCCFRSKRKYMVYAEWGGRIFSIEMAWEWREIEKKQSVEEKKQYENCISFSSPTAKNKHRPNRVKTADQRGAFFFMWKASSHHLLVHSIILRFIQRFLTFIRRFSTISVSRQSTSMCRELWQ